MPCIGAVIAAAVGAVIAVIAIRISGLALALFTLAFALLCDQLLFNFSWTGNGQQGITVPRPQDRLDQLPCRRSRVTATS